MLIAFSRDSRSEVRTLLPGKSNETSEARILLWVEGELRLRSEGTGCPRALASSARLKIAVL